MDRAKSTSLLMCLLQTCRQPPVWHSQVLPSATHQCPSHSLRIQPLAPYHLYGYHVSPLRQLTSFGSSSVGGTTLMLPLSSFAIRSSCVFPSGRNSRPLLCAEDTTSLQAPSEALRS